MDSSQDISELLSQWEFDPFKVNVRRVALEAREVLQMRIDLGVLQLETTDRPDGLRPGGHPSYYHFIQSLADEATDEFELNEEQCLQIDREFVQYYNRRVCWLQLKEFAAAVKDADHTLALMDLCDKYSNDEQWTLTHEQYRPFVIYHRTQAASLDALQKGEGDEEQSPEMAIEIINDGLKRLKTVFEHYGADEKFEEDELVVRLTEFRESLRSRFDVGKTLVEQLAEAIANEQFELAAEIRDLIKDQKNSD